MLKVWNCCGMVIRMEYATSQSWVQFQTPGYIKRITVNALGFHMSLG